MGATERAVRSIVSNREVGKRVTYVINSRSHWRAVFVDPVARMVHMFDPMGRRFPQVEVDALGEAFGGYAILDIG